MEFNQGEAARAKAIAEKKLSEKDFAGAQEFALKALKLFPRLEGIFQLLDMIDVYLAHEKQLYGETNWYGILGVDPSADYESMKREFRRLALSLHPDKNKTPAAEGAFKILSEAWSLLSDKAKRLEYDQRQSIRYTMRTGMNGFNSLGGSFSSAGNPDPSTSPAARPTSPKPSFWTSCKKCMTYFEYLKIHLNQNILCLNCSQPFFAGEVPAPPVDIQNSSKRWTFLQQQQDVCHRVIADAPQSSRGKISSAQNVATPGLPQVGSSSRVKIEFGSLSKPRDARSAPGMFTSATKSSSDFQSAHRAISDVPQSSRREFSSAQSVATPGLPQVGSSSRVKIQFGSLSEPRDARSAPGMFTSATKSSSDFQSSHRAINDAPQSSRREFSSAQSVATPGLPQVGSSSSVKIQFGSLSEPRDARSAPGMFTSATKSSSDFQSAHRAISDVPQSSRREFSSAQSMATPGLPQVGSSNRVKIQFGSLSEPRDARSAPGMFTLATKSSSGFQSARPNTKKGRKDSSNIAVSEAAFGSKSSGPKNKRWVNELKLSGHRNQVAPESGAERIAVPLVNEPKNVRESSPSGRLMQKAQTEILKKQQELSITAASMEERKKRIAPVTAKGISVGSPRKAANMNSVVESSQGSHQSQKSPMPTAHEYLGIEDSACKELDPSAMPLELLKVIKETEAEEAVGKAERSANLERLVGVEGEPHALADEFVAEDKGTNGEVTHRFREPIVTYVRRKSGKKVAADQGTSGEVTHRFREPIITYVRRKSGKKVAVNKDEAKEETMFADA